MRLIRQRPLRPMSDIVAQNATPLKSWGGHVDYPVRGQPLGHVVMTGDGHEAAVDLSAANPLGYRRRSCPRHIAIHHAGELVENNQGKEWRVESGEQRGERGEALEFGE